MKRKAAEKPVVKDKPTKVKNQERANKEANEPQIKVHDSGYKKLFSNHTIFRQLLETFIDESWVKELDFSTCETLAKSFVADHYKTTESDLIYKVRLGERTVYIYILLEFQSKVDRFMVIRVLYYILSFYMDYVRNYTNIEKLPAIFPIVLYNGKEKWTAHTRIQDLIESEPPLGEYAIHFQHLLLNERAYSQEQLLKVRNIVTTLFLAEGHYDIDLLEQELKRVYKQEADKQAVSLLLNWFRQLVLYGKVSPEDYVKLDQVYRTEEEVETMLVDTLKEERKRIYREGEAQGIVKGEAQGVLKGQRQTLLLLLTHRFQLSEDVQIQLTQQLDRIVDQQILKDLTNLGLDVAEMEPFNAYLLKHSPTDKAKDNASQSYPNETKEAV